MSHEKEEVAREQETGEVARQGVAASELVVASVSPYGEKRGGGTDLVGGHVAWKGGV
jgi:hypothetical protein